MTHGNVVVVSDVFRLHPEGAELLNRAGFRAVARYDLVHSATSEQLRSALYEAWAVVAGSERYEADLLGSLPDLRAIARPGVGVDAIDLAAASRAGIAVLTTPGANDASVADHALALTLAVLRRLVEHDSTVRSGGWRDAPIGRDLSGLRVGILGLGSIGRGVAQRLAGFGCSIAATEPAPDLAFCEMHSIALMDLDELVECSDVLTIHAPLTATTTSLIDRQRLERMPSGAILINTSRGPLVDEDALLDALRTGQLAGAGLDVYHDEPLRLGHPLTTIPNVVLTGHVAAFSGQAIDRMVHATIENLRAIATGNGAASVVNDPLARSAAR